MPPSYGNDPYWVVPQYMAKMPSNAAPPTTLRRRLALGVTGAKGRLRGNQRARAAPISRAKARVSVPS